MTNKRQGSDFSHIKTFLSEISLQSSFVNPKTTYYEKEFLIYRYYNRTAYYIFLFL